MYTKIRKLEEGFTIVETLIVLAIAALIITIILIAVPDLQRSARNTDILHDAQNVASAAQSYEGNNQGSVPGVYNTAGTGTVGQTGPSIKIGSTSSGVTSGTVQATTTVAETTVLPTTVKYLTTAVGATVTADVGVGHIVVVMAATCNGATPGGASGTSLAPATDTRGVAVYYPIEGNSTGSVSCIQE